MESWKQIIVMSMLISCKNSLPSFWPGSADARLAAGLLPRLHKLLPGRRGGRERDEHLVVERSPALTGRRDRERRPRELVVQAQVVQLPQRRRRAHRSPDEELRGRRRTADDVADYSTSSLLRPRRRRRCFRATIAATRGRAAAPHDGLQIPVVGGALHDDAARGSIAFVYEGGGGTRGSYGGAGGVVDFGYVCMGVCVSTRLHI
jgi:hypothetical protein